GFALRRLLGVGGAFTGIEEPGLEQRHGLGTVLVLAALVLTLHHDACRQVGETYRRVRRVDVLAARTGGTKRIHTQILAADFDIANLLRFRQYGHGTSGGMDAPLRLRGRNPLYSMRAGFELEP